jgi:hypothetical protein
MQGFKSIFLFCILFLSKIKADLLCEEILAIGYNLLDDPTRNIKHGSAGFCDDFDRFTSPDWKGTG